MTAEVAFLNKRGVVLAADSAVTLGNNKVFNNATKLFTLDSEHFIGIMIFGNADLGHIPWEVIIKMYREKLGNSFKKTVDEYTSDFIKFIEELSFIDLSKQDDLFINRYFLECVNLIKEDVSKVYQEGMDFNQIFLTCLRSIFLFDQNEELLDFEIDKSIFCDHHASDLKEKMHGIWPEINEDTMEVFIDTLWRIMKSSEKFTSAMTGLVIAGYGSEEAFPSLYSYSIDGFLQGKLKCSLRDKSVINDALNGHNSTMIPFAQSDVINTLIHGIDDRLETFRRVQSNNLKEAIRNIPVQDIPNYRDIVDTLFTQNQIAFEQFVNKEFNIPFNEMNSVLSLEELATMAETFISLTSFKRKFSNALESVGGPVDVLVISRGDGPIWVNRKRYFDLGMNQGYAQRRK